MVYKVLIIWLLQILVNSLLFLLFYISSHGVTTLHPTGLFPTAGPQCLLFPLPRMLFIWLFPHLAPSHLSVIDRPLLTTLCKWGCQSPHPHNFLFQDYSYFLQNTANNALNISSSRIETLWGTLSQLPLHLLCLALCLAQSRHSLKSYWNNK